MWGGWYRLVLPLAFWITSGEGVVVDLCTYENVTLPGSTLIANRTLLASTNAVTSPPADGNGQRYDIFYDNDTATNISVTITRTLEHVSLRRVLIRTTLTHNNASDWTELLNVTLHEQLSPGLKADLGTGFSPGVFEPGISVNGRDVITWYLNNVTANNSATIEYYAVAAGGPTGQDLPDGVSFYTSTIAFYLFNSSLYRMVESRVCVERIDNIITSLLYQHGFTALGFFIAFLLGVLIVILLLVFLYRYKRSFLNAIIAPGKIGLQRFKDMRKKVVMDTKVALKKGFNAIKDFSLLAVDESIILILALKDRLQMFREIDNLDILATIHVDEDVEKEGNDAAVQTSLLLLHSLRVNGDISEQVENKLASDFRNSLAEAERRNDVEYRKALEQVYRNLGAKNKERFTEMMERHEVEVTVAKEKAKDCTEQEAEELLRLVGDQHKTEENEQTYILALEQNEESEKLRKEFAVRRRMGIKEEQQRLLDGTASHLTQQQADWLMKEHARQQEAIHRMYDDEISRQRMLLEEKLARRKALAHASESLDDDHVEMLNTMAGHQVMAIQRMRKKDNLSGAQAEEYMATVKSDMLEVKERMDKEKERMQQELHKKLSQRKQQRLADKKRQQEQEVKDYQARTKGEQTDGALDPVKFAEGLLKLRSQHRQEFTALENDIDSEHFHELEEVRNQIAFSGQKELKEMEQTLLRKLQDNEGMSENQVNKLLREHSTEMEELLTRQKRDRGRQKEQLKHDLLQRQQEWEQRKQRERTEQEELRQHEAKVVKRLINSQMSISEAERDAIMKEHEKQMVQLENSLTLNKLRQKRLLEEKLRERRAQQLEKLQQKQDKEIQKQRRAAENNGEESDEESHRQEAALLRKYAEKRIAVMQGHELNLEEEMAAIRQDMTKDRALALKTQEERLGAMIVSLQLQKAREMSQIEEQQRAINNLKMNLMDDLTERGVLSNPECERIIQRHREDQDQLIKRMDSQRKKQEKVIQEKLRLRLDQREKSMIATQERDMQALLSGASSTTAAKIKRALLMHKQMLHLEQFRNQTEREMNQALEDVRRQHEVIRLKAIQDQELQFLAGLVKVGNLQPSDLGPALHMLFPAKSTAQLQEMMTAIVGKAGDGQVPAESTQEGNGTSLVERVRQTQLATGLSSRQNSLRSNQGDSKKRLRNNKKRNSQLSLVSSLNESMPLGDSLRGRGKGKRGSIGAQGVNINGGFEDDDYPPRPGSSLRGSIHDDYPARPTSALRGSIHDDFPARPSSALRGSIHDDRRMSTGSFEPHDDPYSLSGTRGSMGGYRHNVPIEEEGYEYPQQGGYNDYIGEGTGHQLDSRAHQPRALPPLQPKAKKKKKLLKKLAHKNDGYDDDLL